MSNFCCGPDLREAGTICHEKALLRALSDGTDEGAFRIYFDYFKRFKLSHSHVNILGTDTRAKSERKARRVFYHPQHPERPPAFLDVSNWSVSKKPFFSPLLSTCFLLKKIQRFLIFKDLNRLAVLLDCNLVFYVRVGRDNATLLFFRDFRQDLDLPHCRYFVLTQNCLQESGRCLDHLVDEANYFFVRPGNFCKEDNILRGLSKICRRPDASEKIVSPRRLDFLEALSADLHGEWNENVLVVGYKGSRGKFPSSRTSSPKLFSLPKRCIFEVRCLIASAAQKRSMDALNLNSSFGRAICVFGNSNSWCELKPEYLAAVLEQCQLKTNCDVLRDRVETVEVGSGGANLFGQTTEEEEKSRAAKRKATGCDAIRRYCRCRTCRRAKDYDANMRLSGPEKLLSRTLSPGELLSALGLDRWQHLLEELSRLSVAAFDIESMTVGLDHARPGVNLPQADIDFANLGQHNVALQKPIMLAHRDGLMSEGEECPVFTLEDNRESSVYQLMRDYWKFVLGRKRAATAAKRSISAPLLDILEEYQLAYLNYAKDWRYPGDEKQQQLKASEANSGWKFSLPGRLQRHIYQLNERYEIFSFYGAGYDQVLLTGYLVPYLFEKGLRPRLEKSGNKVTVIKVLKCGVTFRDVMRLLSPGTSLKQFGQLFNLQQAKAHFPFGLLTGVEALSLPELPRDPEQWRSDLSTSKEAVSQAEIDEAIGLFFQAGCKNLGDYLRTYLRLDVDILYKATQGWRRKIAEEIGVDFVQTGKFTISSLSSFAGDVNASKNLHVGQFFPNSSAVYRLLRKGMRG